MDIIEAITTRQSVRAYTAQAVAKDIIEKILDAARFAASGVNTQPWQVVVVQGNTKQAITQALIKAYDQQEPMQRDYDYYPENFTEPYKTRRFNCGMALYQALGIQREDVARRQAVWKLNYDFFGAPVGLLFFIDKHLAKGSWVDMGMFIQNVMLAARAHGLATCAQASIADYADIVREVIKYDGDRALICGMALGYADLSNAVNQYRTERETVDSFTQWMD